MGENTLNEHFYKPALGASGAAEKDLFDTKLDVADAQIEANKNSSNMVKCADYDHPDDAITAISTSNKTLLVTEVETCDVNFEVPANVMVKFERGGKWTINTGITVTFNGQIDAGLWQIFDYTGTGTLNFGVEATEKVYPQWWGAIANGTTDCSPAIINAILSLPSTGSGTGGTVYLVAGVYRCNSSITFPIDTGYIKNIKIQGESSSLATGAVSNPYGTRINSYIAGGMLFDLFTDSPICVNVEFRDFEGYDVEATGVNYGIKAYSLSTGCIIENVGFKYFYTSIYISNYCYYAKFDRVASYYARDYGMYIVGANGVELNRITCSNSGTDGLYIAGTQVTILNGYFESNTGRGITFFSGSGHIQSYFEGNGGHSLVAASSVKTLTVLSSYFNIGADKRGIYTDAEQLISIGNYFNGGAYGIWRNAGIACDFGSKFVDQTTATCTSSVLEVDLTEFGYLEGVTSAIQTQLNAKAAIGANADITSLTALTGGQIAFPATQVPSADVNTLDDYEEDAWTPALKFGGNSVDMTYSIQLGLYTKIGRQVTVTGKIVLSAKGTSEGSATITGLPFTCKDDNGAYSAVSLNFTTITFANVPQGIVNKNATTISLREITEAGSESYLIETNFGDTSAIILSATYFTD